MNHVKRIQKEGIDLLLSSGWTEDKIDSLRKCLIDFTSQAFFDEMYQDATLELYDDGEEQTLDIIWKTNHLNVRVDLYEELGAHWDLFVGKIIDGVEVETISSGFGGNSRFTDYDGRKIEDEKWAFHFYWWLEDALNDIRNL